LFLISGIVDKQKEFFMLRFSRRMATLGVLAAAVVAAGAGVPAARAEDKPIQVLRASFQLGDTQKFLDDMGLHLPLSRMVKGNIEEAPFLGAGAIADDKPIGILGFALTLKEGENLDRAIGRSIVLALPVNKGFATVDKLFDFAKGQDPTAAVAGDTITTREVTAKRGADYLLGSNGDLVTQVADNPFKDDYKAAGTLGSATLDLAAVRKGFPKEVDEFWKEVLRGSHSGDKSADEIAASLVRFVREKVDKVDAVTASVTVEKEWLKGGLVVTPVHIKMAGPALPRPTFPAGTILQLHVAYPDAGSAGWAPLAISKLDFAKLDDKGQLTDEQREQIKGIVERTAKLVLTPDAQSVGVTVEGGVPLVMVVNQYQKAGDFDKELRSIAKEINEMTVKAKEASPIDISEYDDGDQKVTRVTLLDNEKPVGYVDVAQAGSKVAMTISPEKIKKVAGLLVLPSKGPLTDFVNVTLDLGEAFKAASATMPIPDDIVKKLQAALTDKTATLAIRSSADGKSMVVEGALPIAVLKELGGVMGPMMGGVETTPVDNGAGGGGM
jgi:hypothetical protein